MLTIDYVCNNVQLSATSNILIMFSIINNNTTKAINV